MPLDSKHTKANFSPNSIDLLHLQLAQVPRSPDLALILSKTTTTTQTIFVPLGHVRRVINNTFWLLVSAYVYTLAVLMVSR